MTISQIFEKKGESFFRIEEEKETLKCLKKNNCVISLGGGAFMNKNIRENVLKNCICYLFIYSYDYLIYVLRNIKE